MPVRTVKTNLWPFSSSESSKRTKSAKKSSMTVSAAMSAAYKAGKASPDTGLFESWLEDKGLDSRSDNLKARLKKEYERGHETNYETGSRYSTDTHERAALSRGPLKYKGYTIREVEGGYSTSLDRESVHDTVQDAKRFIDSEKNPKRKKSLTDELFGSASPETIAREKAERAQWRKEEAERIKDPEYRKRVKRPPHRYKPGDNADDWVPGMKNRRRNPEGEADSAFESFHGTPPTETVIVEEQIHEHEHLWNCGRLIEMVVDTLTGKEMILEWEEGESPFLSCSEDGKQLYIEGGDQELDLASIGMDSDQWIKDRMVIGTFAPPRGKREYNITYRTKKDFDKFEEIDYQHWLGEPSKELRNPSAPFLEYDPISKKLYISGGQYIIKKPVFGTSPGIEN